MFTKSCSFVSLRVHCGFSFGGTVAKPVISFSVAFWIENKEGYHHEISENAVPAGHPVSGCRRRWAGGKQACHARCIACGGSGAIICTPSPAHTGATHDHRCDCGPPGKPV